MSHAAIRVDPDMAHRAGTGKISGSASTERRAAVYFSSCRA